MPMLLRHAFPILLVSIGIKEDSVGAIFADATRLLNWGFGVHHAVGRFTPAAGNLAG